MTNNPGATTLTHVEQGAGVTLYETLCTALAQAVEVDEVLKVRDAGERMKLYARQARDSTMLADAIELKTRSERRLGEILIEARETGQLNRGGRPTKTAQAGGGVIGAATLAEAGINHNLSSKAQKLAGVPEGDFEAFLERSRIKTLSGKAIVVNPIKDLKTREKAVRRAVREAQLAARQRALPQQRFGVIYADPEWPFRTWSDAGKDRSPDNHYPTSLIPVIASRDVAAIAAGDCALFLWITRPLLPAGLLVMEAWGFEYVTCWDWDKVHIGLGFWNRDRSEILLLGTRGNVPCPAPGTQWPSLVSEVKSQVHSQKPEWAYDMIEAYFPNLPRIELNARTRRAGWEAWGFEAPGDEDSSPRSASPDGAATALGTPSRLTDQDEIAEDPAPEVLADGAPALTHGAPGAGEVPSKASPALPPERDAA